ncbi:hypothetical protein [Candidatus Bodocaedibacter vickermanii]|uniref:Uncharacterized protein n=1 Tax=Candidatus Bodocaedibacter vickermanii TaxID=2741701 RepID=A0A7L9RSU2_9PROT|nr:hypothetical protein CPBP_00455 [Candidatus Paracaedibacteraceae bacterium 'Lake Konstanz']
MWKKLLLTTALLSSIYGADTQYFDPEFSLLANRSETLVVNENGVVVNPDTSRPCILRRLTQAEVSKALNFNDFDVLSEAQSSCVRDMWSINLICIILTSDCTLNNGISKALDYELLRRLFWSRVELFEQLVQKMLLSPHIITEDPTGILKEQQKKIAAFSARHDHSDTTPFTKGHFEKRMRLMDEFGKIYDE